MKTLKLVSIKFVILFISYTVSAQTTTFNYTGGMQTFVVPVGINELTVDMYGAKGGDGGLGTKIGGYGGRVQTTLTVTPGQTINIFVGGAGLDGNCVSASPFAGGFNGGGDGYYCGASGGGASDIRIGGTALSNRVVVAGGGGGGGDDYPTGDKGGDGGDLIGANGEYGVDPNSPATGKGGSQIAGGAGGISLVPSIIDDGMPGVLGIGGRSSTTYAGGGGGGGYYGGGGGAGAGGGGGSSYTDPTLTSGTIHMQGENGSNGLVIITEICNSTPPAPDLTSLPDLTGSCSVSAPSSPTATNCLGTYSGTPNVTFPITNQGTTVVTWTYDDGNGSTSTQTQNIIVNDMMPPVANIATLSSVTAECEVTSLTPPTASDNCSGTIVGTHNATLPITAQGTTTIIWTYDDGNGNTSSQTQDVVITDATAPTADLAILPDINSECEVTPTAPTATDNCEGAITGTPDVSFPITASGTTTITWTYDDGNGNSITQTQDIIITPIDVNTTTTSNGSDYTINADASGYNYQWIENCGTANAIINGETNQSYTPTGNGTYAVIIDNGTCSDTSDCIVINDLSVETNDFGPAFSIYPNPTSGNVVIQLGNVFDNTVLKVFNALGQVIMDESFGSTDQVKFVLNEKPGVYIVEISTSDRKSARARVIKR